MKFLQDVTENLLFFGEFIGIVVVFFLIAYGVEKYYRRKAGEKGRILSTNKIAMIGMLSAIATVLHILDFPLPFLAPGFYKLDFSEVPVLIGSFAMGPVAGVLIEVCKILLKLMIKGTSTAFVGDMANFVIGCSFVVPASIMYLYKRSKTNAIIGCIIGTLIMAVLGTLLNAVYLIPMFVKLFPFIESVEDIVASGTAINPWITDLTTFVILAVGPLNLLKGIVVSAITILIYKPLRRFIKIQEK